MHTPWPIRRRVIARRDGARRGEAAYPVLRPWAMDHDVGTWPVPAHRQEASQGRRPVCPCLAHPATQPQTIAPPLARRRADGATPPEWPLAAAHLDRDDGYRGGQLHRPGLARRRDRAAWAVVERGRMRAPDRLARHDGQPRRLREARAPRGGPVACVERPMCQEPPAPRRRPSRGVVAADARRRRTDRRRRGRPATWRRGQLVPWGVPPSSAGMAPERPRAPPRRRLEPVKAAVSPPLVAWSTAPRTTAPR
jgi:hypothetical protein